MIRAENESASTSTATTPATSQVTSARQKNHRVQTNRPQPTPFAQSPATCPAPINQLMPTHDIDPLGRQPSVPLPKCLKRRETESPPETPNHPDTTDEEDVSRKSLRIDGQKAGVQDKDEAEHLHTWRICPVPNNHAFAAVLGVLVYSIAFLFYAQRHKLVLFIMTGLIAICIAVLYTFGVLSLMYMMHRISQMEKVEEESNTEEGWWSSTNTNGSTNTSISSSVNQQNPKRPAIVCNATPKNSVVSSSSVNEDLQSDATVKPKHSLRQEARYSHSKSATSPPPRMAKPSATISLQHSPNATNTNGAVNGSRKASTGHTGISVLEMKF